MRFLHVARTYSDSFSAPTPPCVTCLGCSGESGAGKTESTKLLVSHIIELCRAGNTDLEEKIMVVNPLLEAFGNAKTGRRQVLPWWSGICTLLYLKDHYFLSLSFLTPGTSLFVNAHLSATKVSTTIAPALENILNWSSTGLGPFAALTCAITSLKSHV